MSVGKAFEGPNILLFLATFTNRFVGQQIVKAAVFLRLNHRVPLPVSHHLTLLILQQLAPELPARSPILPNSSLNDPEALEQAPALQTLMTVFLTLKDLTSCRS